MATATVLAATVQGAAGTSCAPPGPQDDSRPAGVVRPCPPWRRRSRT